MAAKEIHQLTAAAALDGTEEVHVRQLGNSRRIPLPGAWRLAATWDHAITGDSANVDFTGLGGAQDIEIFARGVTKSVSGRLAIVVSTDNGSTFYTTSGDYVFMTNAGVEANTTSRAMHDTDATAARNGLAIIHGAAVNGGFKRIQTPWIDTASQRSDAFFVASTLPINAVRIFPLNGGNLTGGKIYCRVRGKAAA